MVTKSKSSLMPLIMSILSIGIALVSIGYCFPLVYDIVTDGWERSSRTIAYFTRIIRGGTA
ncbi:hypothetical protein QWT69_01305 [Sporosarcina oncorhynchi]|uniref:Uncharacterized protein n=1 Tax=Sporosarcina oncorhynchi TaxID=3056444 RepID=A0ABZ0L5F1_9BACL|nr:hypothetical protein [Sporosarcina sp. T2O-4]WOV87786.1 hypothetical protein QWT69_01305 [Sporosarcina sp. T2O-4]